MAKKEKNRNFASSTMRRFLHKILLFSGCFLIGYLLILRLVGTTLLHGNISYIPNNYGHLHSKIAEVANYHDVDVLFLGSSHSYRTFDPRQYATAGISTFNLGSSNQTPLQTLALLQSWLDSLSPKRVIFEVHSDVLLNDGVESAIDMLYNTPINRPMLNMVRKLRSERVYNNLLYSLERGYRNIGPCDSIISLNLVLPDTSFPSTFAYVPGGFVEMQPVYGMRPQPQPPCTIYVNPQQMEALRECIALLKAKNIPYVLLEVPASKALYQSYSNHREFEELMAQEGPYINLNDSVELTSQLLDSIHYVDKDHLNLSGTKIVNEYIIKCILSD